MMLNTRGLLVFLLALSQTNLGASDPTISQAPTSAPTSTPTSAPTSAPTSVPSSSPTKTPSREPTRSPTKSPTKSPTRSPTNSPSGSPSNIPSKSPSNSPSEVPSKTPSKLPSITPSVTVSVAPSATPTFSPSKLPSTFPSASPSITSSVTPTSVPSNTPSNNPSKPPSKFPSALPSKTPSASPLKTKTGTPSLSPSSHPSGIPTKSPSIVGSNLPTLSPSNSPTDVPSSSPSLQPSNLPSLTPSNLPSLTPSLSPSVAPSTTPSHDPTVSNKPTTATPPPTSTPSMKPSISPPVVVSTLVQWEMKSVTTSMNQASKTLFEKESLKWVEFNTQNFVPKVTYTSVVVEEQFLFLGGSTGSGRRLSQLYPLLLKVNFTGALRPEDQASLNLEKTINKLTTNKGDILISDLKRLASESGSNFFANVKTLNSSGVRQDTISQPSPAPFVIASGSDSDNKTSNILIIVLSVLLSILCVGGVLLIVYFKKRNNGNRRPYEPDENDDEKMLPQLGLDARDDDEMTDGGKSQTTFQTLDHLYSQDNQSFSYSLDDGNDSRSIAKTSSLTSLRTKGKSPTNTDNSVSSQRTGKTQLAQVPSSPVSGEELDVSVDDITPLTTGRRGVKKIPNAERVRRDCFAPPGKLGVVIDTTNHGPVVHEVKAGSPLEGVIFAGDRIVAIDDVDTKTLSASAVTKIMARKMEMRRKITVMSSKKVSS